MKKSTSVPVGAIDAPVLSRCRWIDLMLVVGGASCIAAGWPALGAPVVGLGLATPLLRWCGRRRGASDVYDLVPDELAECHRQLVTAAVLPGVPNTDEVVEAADDILLETAALLAGRPARGAAQRRFIAARKRALTDTATELRERHEAWIAACAELDAIAPAVPAASDTRERTSPLASIFIVVLLPVFLTWDVLVLVGRIFVDLVDGLALRMRMLGRLLLGTVGHVTRAGARARRVWTDVRAALVVATAEARGRVTAARLHFRLRLRGARRSARTRAS